jgi:hypothetical protein
MRQQFFRDLSRSSRFRVTLLLAVGAMLLAAPSAGAGGNGGFGCSAGYDSAITLAQGLQLPKIQAGIAAGTGDVAGFTAFFNTIDKNGNGVICVKSPPQSTAANDQPHWLYAYSFADDNSATPNA